MPKISVIVPVYKAEEYLAPCIDSILSQTFSDFELILVDDGSPDASIEICREYAGRDPRIRVLHQENRGQSAARNHGLTIARGDWICFVDSDDLIHSQLLEHLHRAIQETGAAVSMAAYRQGREPWDGFDQSQEATFHYYPMEEGPLLQLYDRDDYPAWVACVKLIPRKLIAEYPFTEGRVYEDNEAVCHWLCQGGSLAKTDTPLYFYRDNHISTTKSSFSLKKLDYLWALESIICYYDSLNYQQLKARFVERYIEAAVQACYGAGSILNQPDTAKEIARNTRSYMKKQNLPLSREQLGSLLDASDPKLARIYWPVSAAVHVLREQGIGGLIRKLLHKGAAQ